MINPYKMERYQNTVLIMKYFINIITLADTLLHDKSLLFPIIFPVNNIGYDINRDAKNVKLPGTMWGIHYNINTIIYSHIENLYNDKIVWFTSTISQVNKYIINLICFLII
jgi:hypothetical protein